ncbi:MAG TPA: trehalose-phosphatase [Actinomycetota bacterium]|nr:trehalose-phosphatase [Actinomycetota bacterium]
MSNHDVLERFRRSPRRGIFLDFDGTLSEIVARPEQAEPVPQARPVLAELARRNDLVAIVSGRRTEDVRALIGVPGIEVFGQYGIEDHRLEGIQNEELKREVDQAAGQVEGAWVEDKKASLAVHYRAAPDPAAAERLLRRSLQAIAEKRGLIVLPGKMVVELAPADTPGKGAVILRETRARRLSGCLFAGDDHADLAAFAALDQLLAGGTTTVKVAVSSEETPQELVEAADLVVERPSGLLELLARL